MHLGPQIFVHIIFNLFINFHLSYAITLKNIHEGNGNSFLKQDDISINYNKEQLFINYNFKIESE